MIWARVILLFTSDSVSLKSAIEADLVVGKARLLTRWEFTGVGDHNLVFLKASDPGSDPLP